MRTRGSALTALLLCLSAAPLAGAVPLPEDAKNGQLSGAEKVKTALEQMTALDHTGQSLKGAADYLHNKLGVQVTLDRWALMQLGIIDDGANGGGMPTPVELKSQNGKVRQALQRMLSPYQLTYVILNDSVLITTENMAAYRQLRQRVSVDAERTPLREVLRRLSRDTATNIIIDPAAEKEAGKMVSLQLEDTSLDNAVRLVTFMGGLHCVRVGNVLLVTTVARAKEIPQEPLVPNPFGPGIEMPAGAGFGGVGVGAIPPAPGFAPGNPMGGVILPNGVPGQAVPGVAPPARPGAPPPDQRDAPPPPQP